MPQSSRSRFLSIAEWRISKFDVSLRRVDRGVVGRLPGTERESWRLEGTKDPSTPAMVTFLISFTLVCMMQSSCVEVLPVEAFQICALTERPRGAAPSRSGMSNALFVADIDSRVSTNQMQAFSPLLVRCT